MGFLFTTGSKSANVTGSSGRNRASAGTVSMRPKGHGKALILEADTFTGTIATDTSYETTRGAKIEITGLTVDKILEQFALDPEYSKNLSPSFVKKVKARYGDKA